VRFLPGELSSVVSSCENFAGKYRNLFYDSRNLCKKPYICCKLIEMNEQNITGKTGEEVACTYLKSCGYRVLHTNWRFQHYELDIVATDGKDLVIVEVKTRSINYLVSPERAVNKQKIKRIACAAEAYQRCHKTDMPIRFDVICLIRNNDIYTVECHIEDAFFSPVN
jgi:putative endonuclease